MTDFKADMIMTASLLDELLIKESELETIEEELWQLDYFVTYGQTYDEAMIEQSEQEFEDSFYYQLKYPS
jgi:hypothetical protein